MTLLVAALAVATTWAQTWTEVGTKEALNSAIADGANIRLTADITLSAYLKIGQNTTQTVTINLNSHTLKRSGLSSPDANGHVIEVFGKGTLTLQNGTLSGGYANNGGGICNYGIVTLNNVTIDKCNGVNGGGIMNYSDATLTINGGSITGCRSIAGGAAIVNHSTADITGCTMNGNTATTRGGAIWSDEMLTISNSTISDNEAATGDHEGDGGAIHLDGGTATLTDVTITNNTSKDAGAIYVVSNATLNINGSSTLSGNTSKEHGGGAITNYGTVALNEKVTITGNTCKTYGGGIWDNGTLSMQGDIVVKDNTSDDIYLKKGKTINVTGALIGSEGSIGVQMEDARGIFTNGYTASGTATIPFVANNINKVSMANGECSQILGFYECSWDEETKEVKRTIRYVSQTQAVDNLCTAKYASGGGLECSQYWFVVNGTGSTTHGLQCREGDVHIILCDDSKLSIAGGLHVNDGSKLFIYCQSYDEKKMGKLTIPSTDENGDAGIGCRENEDAGIIEIHGGNIDATGGKYAAGIGCGNISATGKPKESSAGKLIIHGGIVKAHGGEYGAGVGGGQDNNAINVIVNGGSLHAYGGDDGAGIGTGECFVSGNNDTMPDGGSLTVNGGYVYAKGGEHGAGVGGGQDFDGNTVIVNGGSLDAYGGVDGAGIGSGEGTAGMRVPSGGSLTVNGGRVYAEGDEHGAGVGGGQHANGNEVIVNGGSLLAHGGTDAAGIGSGERGAGLPAIEGGSLTVNGGYVYAEGKGWGAGIGGGEDADGADVTINGGIVEAKAGEDAGNKNGCAIGSEDGDNHRGSLHIADNMRVRAGQTSASSSFTVNERVPACYFRPFARIEPCNHPNATVTINDGETHTANGCTYCLMNGKNQAHFFDNYSECSACHLIGLADDKDNTEAINHWNDERKTVALTNRTFQKNGTWNALCLPFDLNSSNGTPLEGATIMTLDNASFANGTLTINFKEDARIRAGKPYIVKWDNDTEHPTIDNPIFEDVIINNASPNDNAVNTNLLTFQGQYAPLVVGENGDNTLLYIGDDNTLRYPESATTINAFRA